MSAGDKERRKGETHIKRVVRGGQELFRLANVGYDHLDRSEGGSKGGRHERGRSADGVLRGGEEGAVKEGLALSERRGATVSMIY